MPRCDVYSVQHKTCKETIHCKYLYILWQVYMNADDIAGEEYAGRVAKYERKRREVDRSDEVIII